MSRLRIREVLVVEGKYDAVALAGLVDGLIITTDGFSVFNNTEKVELLKRLGRRRGLLVLTDSDAAGFKIRNYIEKVAAGCPIKHAYIPAVPGKEKRKASPGKEGTLGVEGLPPAVLRTALQNAGVQPAAEKAGRKITYTNLYAWGLSGTAGSAARRRMVLARLGLPARLSKKALLQVLNSLYSYEEFAVAIQDKPVLFWDFHGTLTLPDVVWFDAAMEAALQEAPRQPLARHTLEKHLTRACLPWFTVPSGDTRHLTGPNWWAYCQAGFAAMFQKCGYAPGPAAKMAAAMRPKILQVWRYHLYPDAITTLQTLQKRGYNSYIVSNNFPELRDVVDELGLSPYLQGVLVSGLVGYDKPHQGIFEAAKEAAGNKTNFWMIGDNPRDDIEGGNAAGFTTVAVHGVATPAATHKIGNLEGILALLP